MLHGLIYATHAKKLDTDPHGDFGAEIRSLLRLRDAAPGDVHLARPCSRGRTGTRWPRRPAGRRANAGTLVDTHWVGGDPAKLEVYGWACLAGGKAILTLRNPSDRPQAFDVEAGAAFELPAGASGRLRLGSPWRSDAGKPPVELEPGAPQRLQLSPFEVLTLEGAAS